MHTEITTLPEIKYLREAYFNSLPEFQELFLELLVRESVCYLIRANSITIGYAVKTAEGVLVEYYVQEKFFAKSEQYFKALIKELSVKSIYCKSFDALLLSHCLLYNFNYQVIGVQYRNYATPHIQTDPDMDMRPAAISEAEFLLGQDDSIQELFETAEQLSDFIVNEHIFKFYKQSEFIGCGTVIRTSSEWEYCDLGVWVEPAQRGNSYGAQILLKLRDFALKNNMKPSCGCAIENIASQKTIEKSGFVSRYKMLEFKNF